MFLFSHQTIPTLLAGAGAALAAAAVALFSLFPGARFAGLLLVVLAGLLFVSSKHVQGRERWSRTPLDGPILLFLLQMGVSFWASALPDKTWVAVCQLAAGLVAFYAIANWSLDKNRLWWVVVAVVLLGLGMALFAPFAVDWFRDRKTFLPAALYRFFPLLLSDSVHPNVMAGVLVTLLPLPLALFFALPAVSKRQLLLRWGLLVACLAQVVIVVLTKSRGGYIALGVGVWLTLWLSGRRRLAIGVTILVVMLATWLLFRPPSELGGELDATQAAFDASTWAFRQQVWHTAIQIIGDFPFTGVGLGTFNDVAALLYGFYSPDNPGTHNLFLQAAVDLGVLGLISYLAILLLVLWTGFQAYRLFDRLREPALRAVAIGGLAGTMSAMAHGMVDMHTWGSKGAFIPWLVFGMLVSLYGLPLTRSQGAENQQEPVAHD